MSATLAPHHESVEIRAHELQPGDRIVKDGFIGLGVDFVDPHAFRKGFVVVSYTFGRIHGERAFVADEPLVVERLMSGSH